jgi:hypothetical protein
MTANSFFLAAIAALALAGAAHAQETDSDVASTGEQGFRRFASVCRDQKAACDAAFRFGALVGADAAIRCALAGALLLFGPTVAGEWCALDFEDARTLDRLYPWTLGVVIPGAK